MQELKKAFVQIGVTNQTDGALEAELEHLSRICNKVLSVVQRRSAAPEERGPPEEPAARPSSPADPTLALAKQLIRRRRHRNVVLGDTFFGEPVWEIMLDLYIAFREGRRVSLSSACMATSVPLSTAARLIARLIEVGHLRKVPDPQDGRRFWVELCEAKLRSMEALLRDWSQTRTVELVSSR
jgi:hypothetical protein